MNLKNYYGSDINRFIGECLPRVMTTINIDLCQICYSEKKIRICEYKHLNEPMGKQQKNLLLFIAKCFKILNLLNKNKKQFPDIYNWTFQVLVIKGNFPFDKIEITDYLNNKIVTITDFRTICEILCMKRISEDDFILIKKNRSKFEKNICKESYNPITKLFEV